MDNFLFCPKCKLAYSESKGFHFPVEKLHYLDIKLCENCKIKKAVN